MRTLAEYVHSGLARERLAHMFVRLSKMLDALACETGASHLVVYKEETPPICAAASGGMRYASQGWSARAQLYRA
jgi:hypothetical protein